jgi:UDP-glucose 4-epimerase
LSNPRRTLVTGGAGFIGSHLVDRLIEDGHQVTVIDDLSNGKMANLDSASKRGGLSVVEADVSDYLSIEPHFAEVDWVFHLAAKAAIVPSIQEPMVYHRANVDGTVAVLEAARTHGVKRLVYAASSSCYGLAEELPTPEDAPIRPMYPYALTKNVGESYVQHWANVYKLPCVSLRFFNVYGPRSSTSGAYGAVFGVFLAQKLAGEPLTVVGDGEQSRDFTFVTDVAAACVNAAESDLVGEIMNVGSGNTCSINYLVSLIGGEVVHLPKRPGEPDSTFADTAKIKRLLGWSPKVSLEEGVQIMMDRIELWRNAPVWNESSIAEATRDWFEYLSDSGTDPKEIDQSGAE